jgi:hypothetical protein
MLLGMDATHSASTPPEVLTLLSRLTVAEVRARLDAIEDERRALLTLLRSVRARDRSAARRQEVPRAS